MVLYYCDIYIKWGEVLQEFIENKMRMISDDFYQNLNMKKCYCELKQFRFDSNNIPNYNKQIFQQYYLLKYLPGYFVEYYYIYSSIINDKFIEDDLNILSVGCGAGIDLWSAHYAFLNNAYNRRIRYTGLDIVDWGYWDDCDEEAYFLNNDINHLNKLDEEEYNIIIFPKSIGEFDSRCFDKLKECIENTNFTKEKIIFIASMRKARAQEDVSRFSEIISLMINKNYYALDNHNRWNIFRKKKNGYDYRISDIISNLKYPSNIEELVTTFYKNCEGYKDNGLKCCESECKEIFTRRPIKTMSQVAYTIIRLEKKV